MDASKIKKAAKSKKPADIQVAARDFLTNNPNIVAWLDLKSTAIDVFGASGSTTSELTMIDDGTGQLDLGADDDPAVMKRGLDYVKEGQEPEGVIRATMESWATSADLKNPSK